MRSHRHLLNLPLELRYYLFGTIIYTPHTIVISRGSSNLQSIQNDKKGTAPKSGNSTGAHLIDLNPESGGPFEALSLTCTQLRHEIAKWIRAEQNGCKDLVLTRAFGILHTRKSSFLLNFTPADIPTTRSGERVVRLFLHSSGSQRKEFLGLDMQAEIIGLWRDIIVRTGTKDIDDVGRRIKWRLCDRGWREQDCLKAVWAAHKTRFPRTVEMIPNLEWENWELLAPGVVAQLE